MYIFSVVVWGGGDTTWKTKNSFILLIANLYIVYSSRTFIGTG